MSPGTAYLGRPPVHHFHETGLASPDMECDHIRRVCSGPEHQAVNHLFCGETVPFLDTGHAGILVRDVDLLPCSPVLREIRVFQRQEAGHDLCDARRIHTLQRVPGIDSLCSAFPAQDHTVGLDGRIVVHRVCNDGEIRAEGLQGSCRCLVTQELLRRGGKNIPVL